MRYESESELLADLEALIPYTWRDKSDFDAVLRDIGRELHYDYALWAKERRDLKRQIEIQAATIEELAKRLSKLLGSIVDLRNELAATLSPTRTMWIMAELERIGELEP